MLRRYVQVVQQVLTLLLEERREEAVLERLVPEAADVDAQALPLLQDLPSDHISALSTRMSRCDGIMLALFRTNSLFSECFLASLIAILNSSEMSSLCASKTRTIMSQRSQTTG